MSVFTQIIVWAKTCPSCFASNPDSESSCGNALTPDNPWPR